MTERETREALVEHGRSLFMRGYSCGTSGNLSVRLPEEGGYLMSPTNVSLGRLTTEAISRLDPAGHHVGGAPPTKEAWLHLAMYAARPDDRRWCTSTRRMRRRCPAAAIARPMTCCRR